MILAAKIEELGDKPVAQTLCPPQFANGSTEARTLVSAVRSQRLCHSMANGSHSWTLCLTTMTMVGDVTMENKVLYLI
jgi:hypothetical protein